MELVEKLKDCFDEMLVYKDLKKTNLTRKRLTREFVKLAKMPIIH